jgi:hypothetical protein
MELAMRLNPSKPFSLLLLALSLSLLSGCGAGGRKAALGEQFKLTPNESVSIKETPLAVELKGVRRTWYTDGKGETADADLIITLDGEEHQQWLKAGEEKAVGDYNVKVWGADPFGKTSAEIIVTRRL